MKWMRCFEGWRAKGPGVARRKEGGGLAQARRGVGPARPPTQKTLMPQCAKKRPAALLETDENPPNV